METVKYALAFALVVGMSAAQTPSPGSGLAGSPGGSSGGSSGGKKPTPAPGGGGLAPGLPGGATGGGALPPPGVGVPGGPGMGPGVGGTPGGMPGTPGMPGVSVVKPPKTRLEQLLEDTYRHNAEIRLAEARLVEAQAMLAKVRMDVTQKVVQAEAAIRLAELEVEAATSNLKLAEESSKSGLASGAVREKARQDVLRAKAALETARTNLDYVTGKAEKALPGGRPGGGPFGGGGVLGGGGQIGGGGGQIGGGGGAIGGMPGGGAPPAPLGEDFRKAIDKALSTTIDFDFSEKTRKGPVTLGTALKNINDTYAMEGVFAPAAPMKEGGLLNTKIPPYERFERSLGAFLVMLEDDLGQGDGLCFIVCEYGIRPWSVNAKRPEGATYLRDYLKALREKKPAG